jgi:NAD(P)-dependent dehydrogenase (short-subunit alcohol dehydrogenase family)
MKKALITGANRSIGYEAARQLLKLGYHVYIGSRSLEKGQEAVAKLKEEGLAEAEALQLDVTSEGSVKAAAAAVAAKADSLDVLINNAGISGGFPQTASGVATSVIEDVFATNFFGVARVTRAFLDLLRKSDQPRIVNVTSGLGSLTLHTDPTWKYYPVKGAAYNTSKAALNMYTITLAYELRDTAFKVNAVDPGYTATEFNHFSGPGSIEDAAARLVKCATIDAGGPSGAFFSEDNAPDTGISPW